MNNNGICIVCPKKPHPWDFKASAAVFYETRDSVLHLRNNSFMYEGKWCSLCLAVKGFVGIDLDVKKLTELRGYFQKYLRLKSGNHPYRYSTIELIAKTFSVELAYPPYPLTDDFDGKADERRLIAERYLRQGYTIV